MLHEFGEADAPTGRFDLLPDVLAYTFAVFGTVCVRLRERWRQIVLHVNIV